MSQAPSRKSQGLAEFIRNNLESILQRWEAFARSIPSGRKMDTKALRDHASGMLKNIADQIEHKEGAAQNQDGSNAAQHGAERLAGGFSVNEAVSEFRSLRASVLHFWVESLGPDQPIPNDDLICFNEAIDQVLAESLERYSLNKENIARRFDTLLSSSPDLQYIIGTEGKLIYANRTLANLLGSSEQEATGKTVVELCPELAGQFTHDMQAVIATREPVRGEFSFKPESGPAVTYRYVLIPVMGDDDKVDSITGSGRNISELKASEEKIIRNAYYDSLTELPNRRLFRDRLEQEVKHAWRTGLTLAVFFVDLDGFKEVNDRCGHATGDRLLWECARRISACVRDSDTVARIGGDEFTVILAEVTRTAHVEILAQQILDALALPFHIDGTTVHISGSIGMTLYPQDALVPDELLRNADQAMFVAKNAGRNRFSFFTPEMRDSAWARLKVIEELRHALSRHELAVYYQPIVEMATETIVKAEALLRWHHPHEGLILPDQFIGLAEETGMIGDIGAWVMAQAMQRARHWSGKMGRPFQISVNKSPVEFMSKAQLEPRAGFAHLTCAGELIAVEITEGVMLNDSPSVREKLNDLQRAGVKFTIDDFGIGYSSMAYLKKFKVDFLKIDQSFIKDMMTSADSRIFAETIVQMAHKLGLEVIAEGVETAEQRDWLKGVGCDYAQGFLYSEAASCEQFEAMLGLH